MCGQIQCQSTSVLGPRPAPVPKKLEFINILFGDLCIYTELDAFATVRLYITLSLLRNSVHHFLRNVDTF